MKDSDLLIGLALVSLAAWYANRPAPAEASPVINASSNVNVEDDSDDIVRMVLDDVLRRLEETGKNASVSYESPRFTLDITTITSGRAFCWDAWELVSKPGGGFTGGNAHTVCMNIPGT